MFGYQDRAFYCEDVSLSDIATAVGTPTYVYSRAAIVARARAYLTNLPPDGLACYALKANSNLQILRLLAEIGLGADVTSGGELYLARKAGFPTEKTIFSGVGKTDAEIRQALSYGLRALHVESAMELAVVGEIAAEMGVVAPVGVRMNPNIDAETHPYISTGLHKHKFGVPIDQGIALLQQAQEHAFLRPVSIASHIGSQIRSLNPYAEAAQLLSDVAQELKTAGISLNYIDIGGGWGLDYEAMNGGDGVTEIGRWLDEVKKPIDQAGFKFVAEPGRSIVGSAGCLLAQVVYTKQSAVKNFLITDAGMSDLIRPTLYQAYHPIVPLVCDTTAPEQVVDVVGPICESSDFLAKDRSLPQMERGDLLAVLNAGAYSFAMSSNYNGRLRPAEVLVNGSEWHIIRSRETFDVLH